MVLFLAHGELGWTDEITTAIVVIVMVVFLFALWRGKRQDTRQRELEEESQEVAQDQTNTID